MAVDQGRTLLELRTEIQDLGYGTDTAAVQTRALNAVQRRVSALRRWKWAEGTDTLTLNTAASVISISAKTTWSAIDALRLFDGTEELPWEYLEPEEFRRRQWEFGLETGRPLYWTYYGNEVRTLPTSDKLYSITADVVLSPVDMSLDADRSIVPARYSGVLVWGAIERLARRQRDAMGKAEASEQFAREINAMITAGQIAQRQNVTHVPHSKTWDSVGGGRRIWLS